MMGEKDDEMATRWVQLGCFSPIMRLHSSNSQWTRKEPWTYGPQAEKVMTKFLRLRHRLLPYLYTMNAKSAIEGTPLVRPMYWEYPEQDEAYQNPNQYLFGSQLIVMPIVTPQDPKLRLAKTKGWLPAGKYIDIMSGALYTGDRQLWLSRTLEDYPVFAKEGAIIPLDAATEPGNGGEDPDRLEILVVVGADGHFELLEDDGSGRSTNEVKWTKTPLTYRQETGTLTIGPSTGEKSTIQRELQVTFLGLDDYQVAHSSVECKKTKTMTRQGGVVMSLNLGKVDHNTPTTVSIGPKPELRQNNVESLVRPILADAQIRFGLKEEIWRIVASKASNTHKVSSLLALEMEENFRHAVLEYVLAE